jgi:hypothetical protein
MVIKEELENNISEVHENYFYKEFTFSLNNLTATGGDIEFADNFVYLGEIAFVYQMKNRKKKEQPTTLDKEKKWFEKKVVGKGSKQIRDSINVLKQKESFLLTNQRGHEVEIIPSTIKTLHKVIIYSPNDKLSSEYFNKKFHDSAEGGFIHLFPEQVYKGLAHALLTLTELSDYLVFRETLIKRWGAEMNDLTYVIEAALLGQYLHNDIESKPDNTYKEYYPKHVANQKSTVQDWDMSGVLHKAFERAGGSEEYYFWMKEIAKLNRFELKEFKELWAKTMNQAFRNMACPPHFLISSRTKCGFVFLPILQADTYRADKNLISVVTAEKYRHKIDKCIGFSFLAGEGGFYDNQIMCDEFKWVPNQVLEKLVQEGEELGHLRLLPMY